MTDLPKFWSRALLRLGVLLLAIGLVPLAVAQIFGFDSLVPLLLGLSVAPLGAIALAVGLILFLVALLRRRQGSS